MYIAEAINSNTLKTFSIAVTRTIISSSPYTKLAGRSFVQR
jgi:hypothetical protein